MTLPHQQMVDVLELGTEYILALDEFQELIEDFGNVDVMESFDDIDDWDAYVSPKIERWVRARARFEAAVEAIT